MRQRLQLPNSNHLAHLDLSEQQFCRHWQLAWYPLSCKHVMWGTVKGQCGRFHFKSPRRCDGVVVVSGGSLDTNKVNNDNMNVTILQSTPFVLLS
jgi:hypothetical protein